MTYNKKISDDSILSCSYQTNFVINLPINSNTNNIYDCFNLYLQDNILSGQNALYNEKTGKKEDVIQETMFWDLPDILIICLKRYSFDGTKKQNKNIQFPIYDLDMTKYIHGYNKNKYVYHLYGICNHSGRLQYGHYTSYVKTINDKWYHYNDTSVTKISEDKLITPKAYCLFYSKKY